MHIEKRKLSKGQSYPLRASVLEAALSTSAIAADTQFVQGGGSKLFECFFWPPNPNVPRERLYIRTTAVPETGTNEARTFIENSVIPEFVAWLQGILALAPNSTVRREEQYFERSLP
ncbi:MAG: hypothetical protein JNJ60_14245 [Rhodocyclaceae bacterium]|nr:hypothetical protein [Rhodocyclaceae bacterium]